MSIDVSTFFSRLVLLRAELGLNSSELGVKMGVSGQGANQWERGKSYPRADNLVLLVANTGVSPLWLLMGEGPMFLDNRETRVATKDAATIESQLKTAIKERDTVIAENRELRTQMKSALRTIEKLSGASPKKPQVSREELLRMIEALPEDEGQALGTSRPGDKKTGSD